MAAVLVIDDDPSYRTALRRALVLEGFRVILASDGDEGLELFRMRPPDLVVVDLFMPGQEGLATIREMREESPEIPILAISGAASRGLGGLLRMAELQGATRTIAKPFDDGFFVEIVRELLDG